MDRRRALSQRPASSEEIQCWSHASSTLSTFSEKYNNPATERAIARVNRLISAWPANNGDDALPMDGFESAKDVYKKLSSGLKEIEATAKTEVSAIEEALESISVIIALRKAPEPILPPEKRNKRPRGSSPSSAPATPAMTPVNRITLNIKADREHASEGPAPHPPFKRDAKTRAKYYSKQAPFQEGRKVALLPPGSAGKGKGGDGDTGDDAWMLAVIIRAIDKHRYEVQDAEPQDDGQPGQIYVATLKDMIPLPDPDAPPSSHAHISAYPEFLAGSTVMALYPDTSCFYRAEVLQGPRDPQNARTLPSSKQAAMYRLSFEDDEGQVHSVAAQWVVEWPGS